MNINEAAVFKFWILGEVPHVIVHNKFYDSIYDGGGHKQQTLKAAAAAAAAAAATATRGQRRQ